MNRRVAWVTVGVVGLALVGAGVVATADDDGSTDERVGAGQEPSDTAVPADMDAFVADDSLARQEVTGVGDRFVVVQGGREPAVSVLDASGRAVSEVAVPVAEGTGLGRAQVRAIGDDRALVTGVHCSTAREDSDVGVLCDPGDAFVATLALESQEWTVAPGAIDPGPVQDIVPLGVADGRAVIQAYEDIRTIDLATGATEDLPPGGGPTEGSGVRCLIGDVVVRGDTFSSPAMQRPEPGEVTPTGDEPFPPFGASTFDLSTGEWGSFVPGPEQRTFEDSSYYLHCGGDEVVALPGQPSTADGEPLSAYRFSVETGRWQPFPAPPFDEPSAWISVDAPSGDVVALITTDPEVGGFALAPDGRWRRFAVDLDGAEARQAAATATHIAILTQDGTLDIEALS